MTFDPDDEEPFDEFAAGILGVARVYRDAAREEDEGEGE